MDPLITTALIGGGCAVAAAAVPTILSMRTNRRVGSPDGHGTLMEMTAQILAMVQDHGSRLLALERERYYRTGVNGGKPPGADTAASEETSERG